MAGGVTYDNVASAEGGNIFDGLSFWVAVRVPMRDKILEMIKSNGGTVVELEKNASYLIADPPRKNNPPNSYSWEFITHSVEHGILQLEDKYMLEPTTAGKPPSKGGPSGSRIPFTPADDHFLAHWLVIKKKGIAFTPGYAGNKPYYDIEAANNRHTWQSWRNRFVKKLYALPREDLERMALLHAEGLVHQNDDTQLTATPPAAQPQPQARQEQTSRATREHPPDSPGRPTDSRITHTEPPSAQENHENFSAVLQLSREAFNERLDVYADYCHDQGQPIVINPLLDNRRISSWALTRAVLSQDTNPEHASWEKVAQHLGFSTATARRLSLKLLAYWEQNLAVFCDMLLQCEEAEHTDPDAEAGTPASPPASPPASLPTSKLQTPHNSVAGTKRTHDPEGIKTPVKKKKKLGRGDVIPCSPEDTSMVNQGPDNSNRTSLPHSATGPYEDGLFLDDGIGDQPEGQETHMSPSQQLRHEYEDNLPGSQEAHDGRKTWSSLTDEDTSNRSQPDSPSMRLGRPRAGNVVEVAASSPVRLGKAPQAVRRSLPASMKASTNTHVSTQSPQLPRSASKQSVRDSTVTEDFDGEPMDERTVGNRPEIRDILEYYQSLGYSHDIVVEALRRTTMTPGGQAAEVMESLKSGNGIPSHYEGVWTDRDDQSLKLVTTTDLDIALPKGLEKRAQDKARRELKRLLHKHGPERLELRKQFLEAEASASHVSKR